MTIAVMLLLGAGLAAILGVAERRLMRLALSRRPGPLPPWGTVVTIGLVYAGWGGIRLLSMMEISKGIDRHVFTYAALAYAVVHIDVALFVVSNIEGPTRERLRLFWGPLAKKAGRVSAAVLLAAAGAAVSLEQDDFDAPIVRTLAAAAGIVGALCVILEARLADRSVSAAPRS